MNDQETKERWAQLSLIRIRIMQEAYDLADRNDSEGYNAIKVMCSDVLQMVDELIEAKLKEKNV